MYLVTGFYCGVLLTGICCALLFMFAPNVACVLAKGLMVSLLLFIASIMLRPDASSGLLAGGLRLLLSFALFASSILCVLAPSVMKQLLTADTFGASPRTRR